MTGLLGSVALEVAIGLAFLYLLLAIFCTTVNEWVAGLLKRRANTLKQGLQELLDDQPLAEGKTFLEAFYKHPLITSMMRNGRHPSYLSAKTFAKTVMALASSNRAGVMTFAQLAGGINALPDGDVKKTLVALLQNTNADVARAQEAIESWFNDAMDRVSGWYKRRSQVSTVAIALGLTIVSNADTIHAARLLWITPALRSAVVEQARAEAEKPRPQISVEYPDKNAPSKPKVTSNSRAGLSDQERAVLDQMIGWSSVTAQDSTGRWAERLLGWALTAIAVSLGAPFWFDTLNRFMNLRNAGRSPSETEKGSGKK